MKNIIVICIILFSSQISFANSHFNNAKLWNSWSVESQEAYISGVIDGIAESFLLNMTTSTTDKFYENPPSPEVKKATDQLFTLIRYTKGQLREEITDLYSDPANSHIDTLDILIIARDKIEGKDISGKLLTSRKNAIGSYEFN